MSTQRDALCSSVVGCLTAILGGHGQERKSAEDELKALEVTDGRRVSVACDVQDQLILCLCTFVRFWSGAH